ncbi:MAG: cytochrome b [Rhodanobacter sp.]
MNDSRFSAWTRRLHWLVFSLVATALILVYAHGWTPKGSPIRAQFKWAHMQFGIAVILVMLPRVIARWRGGRPPIVPPLPSWQKWLAHLVQYALYAALFAVPLLGIASRLWSPDTWNFLGLPLPRVPVTDKVFSKQLEGVHETLGNALMYLAATHAAIALVHHLILRDSALQGMLPFWRRVDIAHAGSRTSTESKSE